MSHGHFSSFQRKLNCLPSTETVADFHQDSYEVFCLCGIDNLFSQLQDWKFVQIVNFHYAKMAFMYVCGTIRNSA